MKGKRRLLGFTALALAIVVVGCSGDGSRSAARSEPDVASSPTTSAPAATPPPECVLAPSPADPKETGSTTVDPECRDRQFAAAAASADLDAELMRRLGASFCSYAEILPTIADPPTLSDLVVANSGSWGVTEDQARTIIIAARSLCPDAMEAVSLLPVGASSLEVTMRIEGIGSAQVVYTGSGGESVQEVHTLPWSTEVSVDSASAASIGARPFDDAEGTVAITCAIELGGRRLVAASSADESGQGQAMCVVTPEQMAAAARAG